MRMAVAGLVSLVIGLLGAPGAMAQPACPTGNLLKGAQVKTRGVSRKAVLTNDVAPKEGDGWNTSLTAVMSGSKAEIVWDLGKPTRIGAVALQGDNNDTYTVSISTDGAAYTPLWVAPQHPNPGMRTRLHLANAEARYLKVHGAKGDNAYSLGEVQAFCEKPAAWPPAWKRASGKAKGPKKARKSRMAQSKMTFGICALAVFLGLALARRETITPAIRNIGGAWTFASLVASYVFYRELGYVQPAYAALGHLPIGLLLMWWLGRPEASLKRIGHTIATIGGMAALLYASWRMYGEFSGRVTDTNGYGFRVNFITVAIIGALGVLSMLVMRLIRNEALGPLFRRAALLAVVVGGGITWVNFGTFHGSRAVHYWDSFHYYMGSKYFKETRYHLLYHCAAIGEVDDGRGKEFAKRQIRDLRNNKLLPAVPQLSRDEECRANFTPERWAAFRQDLRLFRSQMGSAWWKKMFKDHGYNASPVWNAAGNLFANYDWAAHVPPADLTNSPANLRGKSAAERKKILKNFNSEQVPAFKERIQRLALIDGALYIGIFLLIWWGFGLEVCALAMAVLAVGYPWAYFWTGGGYGRVPWLFMATAGVCCMKRGWPLLGGFAVTWSTLLRAFPGAIAAGVVLRVGWNLVRHKTVTRTHRRVILGAMLGLAVLVPASLPSADGVEAYKEFLDNSMKHKKTPLTNHMGMPALVAWGPKLVARHTKNSKLTDPFKIWKEKRLSTLEDRKLLHYGLLAMFLALIWFCSTRMPDWEATAISTIMIIGIFDLTCYYYNFIILLAPVVMRRARYIGVYLGMAIASQIVHLKVGWYDEQYLAETVLVLGTLLYIIGDIAWSIRKDPERDFPGNVPLGKLFGTRRPDPKPEEAPAAG